MSFAIRVWSQLIPCLLIIAFAPHQAAADQWISPEQASFHSTNRNYMFVVVPGRKQLGPIGLKITQHELSRFTALGQDSARGLLCKLSDEGSCEVAWRARLPYPVAPASALVSDSGRIVITFDQWGRAGYGDVIVIYDYSGSVIRKYRLEDFLTSDEILRVPTTVSSRWWSGISLPNYLHTINREESELTLKVQLDMTTTVIEPSNLPGVPDISTMDPPRYIIRTVPVPSQ